MPWHDEIKDDLAIALHRESKGKAKLYPNWMTELRKSGKPDNEIVQAFREHISALTYEPKNSRAWQRVASRFIYEFRTANTGTAKVSTMKPTVAEYTEAEEQAMQVAMFGSVR